LKQSKLYLLPTKDLSFLLSISDVVLALCFKTGVYKTSQY